MENRVAHLIANFSDMLLDAVCMVDLDGRFVFASAACERIFGYTQDEMVGRVMIDMVAPADRERTLAAAQAIIGGQPNNRFENRYIRKDGRIVHILWSARWSEAHQLRIAVAHDITSSKRAEAMQSALYAISEAAQTTEDLAELFRLIHQIIGKLLPSPGFAVALRDERGRSLHFAYDVLTDGHADGQTDRQAALTESRTAQAQLARALSEEVLRSGRPLLLAPDAAEHLPELPPAIANNSPTSHTLFTSSAYWLGVPLATPQGPIGVLLVHSASADAAYTEADQELLEFVSTQIATAIQRKQLHTRLLHMAQHDELTQLPNRRLFHDRLEMAFARAQRQQTRLSLLFIDLNKFKQVNDDYGHACGDLMLKAAASRIKDCVRETDTVARLGGDEFVVILEQLTQPEHAALLKEKIHQALAAPVDLGEGRAPGIAASIGVANYPEHGIDPQQLMRYADQAMYASKLSG